MYDYNYNDSIKKLELFFDYVMKNRIPLTEINTNDSVLLSKRGNITTAHISINKRNSELYEDLKGIVAIAIKLKKSHRENIKDFLAISEKIYNHKFIDQQAETVETNVLFPKNKNPNKIYEFPDVIISSKNPEDPLNHLYFIENIKTYEPQSINGNFGDIFIAPFNKPGTTKKLYDAIVIPITTEESLDKLRGIEKVIKEINLNNEIEIPEKIYRDYGILNDPERMEMYFEIISEFYDDTYGTFINRDRIETEEDSIKKEIEANKLFALEEEYAISEKNHKRNNPKTKKLDTILNKEEKRELEEIINKTIAKKEYRICDTTNNKALHIKQSNNIPNRYNVTIKIQKKGLKMPYNLLKRFSSDSHTFYLKFKTINTYSFETAIYSDDFIRTLINRSLEEATIFSAKRTKSIEIRLKDNLKSFREIIKEKNKNLEKELRENSTVIIYEVNLNLKDLITTLKDDYYRL